MQNGGFKLRGRCPIQGRSVKEWIRQTFGVKFVQPVPSRPNRKFFHIARCLAEAKTNSVIFMSTQSGYVGWASHTAEAGDSIIFFRAAVFPSFFVAVLKGATRSRNAYVQGVMNGELMQPDLKSRGRVGSRERNWVDRDIY